jgi:hypothetical protein
MAPPTYADLGKASRDLFSKGYNFGSIKLDTTTKSGDVQFKTGAAHNVTKGDLAGNIEIKYNIPKYGMTLTEKWNTANVLGTEVSIVDKVAKGVKVTLDSQYNPAAAKRTGKLKLDYAHERVRTTVDASLDAAPLVQATAVGVHEGWLLGLSAGYDVGKSALVNSAFSLCLARGDYNLHTYINDGTKFGGNVYHKVSGRMELGANVGWESGTNASSFGVAAKYKFAPETTLQAKVNNNSELAASMIHDLADGFKLTLSGMATLKGFQEGNHRFGLGLEYNP